MTYYYADYYKNPTPYTSSDVGAPVPGWGVSRTIAGPARIGVGAEVAFQPKSGIKISPEQTVSLIEQLAAKGLVQQEAVPIARAAAARRIAEADKPMPWWVWPAGAVVVLGVVGYIGVEKGWI